MAVDITIIESKFAMRGGRNLWPVRELLCCDSGIIRFDKSWTACCDQSGWHSKSASKTNPHLNPLPLQKGEATQEAADENTWTRATTQRLTLNIEL